MVHNLLYRVYFLLPNFGRFGLIGKVVNRILDLYLMRPILEFLVPRVFGGSSNAPVGVTETKRNIPVIISLTSFPERISDAWISIECLMRQTVKADRIILWLATTQFPDQKLPQSLIELKKRGLEVEFCENIRSHKKYLFTIQNNPNARVVTFDDDLYYDNKVLSNLLKLNDLYPGCIVANRAHEIKCRKKELLPYKKWLHNSVSSTPSFRLFHTSGAGVLFPPNILPAETFQIDLIKRLSPKSDDVWLKVMSVIGDIKVVSNQRYNKDFCTVKSTQDISLVSENTGLGQKDEQLKNVLEYFQVEPSVFCRK